MSRRDGWTERLLAWAVADDEAAEGLLGDLREEFGGGPSRLRSPRHAAAVVGLALRYLGARVLASNRLASGDRLTREISFAIRSLVRARGYSALFVGTLALGLGAALTMFTVVESVVLRPLPYDDAGRLVRIQSAVPASRWFDRPWHLAKAQYLYLEREVSSLSDIGLYRLGAATVVRGDSDVPAERVSTATVNPAMFSTLRIAPALGRSFTAEESLEENAATAMISHRYWTRAFGRDPAVLGKPIVVNDERLDIVGVLPSRARLPEELRTASLDVDLWTPLYLSPVERPLNNHVWNSIGRLAPEADIASLNSELARLSATLPDIFPAVYSRQFMEDYGFTTVATVLRDDVIGNIKGTLWTIFGAVSLLLLVACFNCANLLLARTQRRARELGVRSALGAGRGALARQLLFEATVLCILAGIAAAGLAALGAEAFVATAPEGLPRLEGVSPSLVSLAFVATVAVIFAVLFGILPLIGRSDLTTSLGGGGRSTTASPRQATARQSLVVAQLAVSLVLLAGATLLLQSYRHLSNVDSGIEPEDVLTFQVHLQAEQYPDYGAAASFYRRATEALESRSGILAVGGVDNLPLTGGDGCTASYREGFQPSRDNPPPCAQVSLVTPGYFEAMGIPVRGEALSWAALDDERMEVVVSGAAARRFWGDQEPIGLRVSSYGAPLAPVRGVVGDVRGGGLREPVWDAIYLSIVPPGGSRSYWGVPRFLHFVVRTDGTDPSVMEATVRHVITAIDPRVPVTAVRPMTEIVVASTADDSFITLVMAVASALSLLLSALGVYAVISYIVQGRRGEIGVRLALGAERGQVRGLVVGQSLRLAVLGVAVGLALAVPVARVLRAFLFEVSPSDPLTLALASVALVAVAAVASFAPALRATRIDPVEALRSD